MSKFKIGAEVRCVKSYRDHVIEGRVYTVLDVTGDMYLHVDTGDRIIGVGGYAAERFELVQNEPEYLTPEQVLKALQDDPTKVEVKYGINGEFVSADTVHPITYVDITQGKWRFKQVPKTIDYYGTELPKPIDISKLDGSTVVYAPQVHRAKVSQMTVDFINKYRFQDGLHFSTYEDAKLVLDTLRKPFKQ